MSNQEKMDYLERTVTKQTAQIRDLQSELDIKSRYADQWELLALSAQEGIELLKKQISELVKQTTVLH